MKKGLFTFALLIMAIMVNAQQISIIPQPTKSTVLDGEFLLSKETSFDFDSNDEELKSIANITGSGFVTYFGEFFGDIAVVIDGRRL